MRVGPSLHVGKFVHDVGYKWTKRKQVLYGTEMYSKVGNQYDILYLACDLKKSFTET